MHNPTECVEECNFYYEDGFYSKVPKEIVQLIVESGSNFLRNSGTGVSKSNSRSTFAIAWVLTFRQVDKFCNALLASSCEPPTINPKSFDSLWESMANRTYFGFCDIHTLKAQSLLEYAKVNGTVGMKIPSYHPLWKMLLKEEGNFLSEEVNYTGIERYLLGEKNSDELTVQIIIEKKSRKSYNVGLYVADDDEIYVDSHINKSRRGIFPMTFHDQTVELLAFLMRKDIYLDWATWSWTWEGKKFCFNKELNKFVWTVDDEKFTQ